MLDAFLTIFYATCIQMIDLIVPIIAIWILFDLISSLLFKG